MDLQQHGEELKRGLKDRHIQLIAIGGAIGVVLGAGATWAIGYFAGWQVTMTPASILLAAGFSGFVGVLFGFYPARRASRLLPIQALRYE